MEEGLEIGAGVELILQAELFDQLEVVVDFPIADDRGAGGAERLPAALQVDDRQPRVRQEFSREVVVERWRGLVAAYGES